MIGDNYPLSPVRQVLSKAVSFGQTGLMIVGLGGRFIPFINNHPLYRQFQDKSMFILLGGYFGLNMLQNAVSSTGAFEVYVNDRLVFSKVATGHMPTVDDITSHL